MAKIMIVPNKIKTKCLKKTNSHWYLIYLRLLKKLRLVKKNKPIKNNKIIKKNKICLYFFHHS